MQRHPERHSKGPEQLASKERSRIGAWAQQTFEQLRTATNLDFRAKQGARGLLMALMMGVQADHEPLPVAPNFPRTAEQLKEDIMPQFKQELRAAILSGKEVNLRGAVLNSQVDIDNDGYLDGHRLEELLVTDGTFPSYDTTNPEQLFVDVGYSDNPKMPPLLLVESMKAADNSKSKYAEVTVPGYSVTVFKAGDHAQAEVVSWMQERAIGVVDIPTQEVIKWSEYWSERRSQIDTEVEALNIADEEARDLEVLRRMDAEKNANPEWKKLQSQFFPQIVEIVRTQRATDQELFREFARQTLAEKAAADTDATNGEANAVKDTDSYTLDWKFSPDGNGLATLRVLNEIADISFDSNSSQAKVERLSGKESLEFERGSLSEYGQGSLVLNGMVESVQLMIRDSAGMPTLNRDQTFRDQFGNTIKVVMGGEHPWIKVRIPRPFVFDEVQVSQSISLDLTSIGLGVYENIAEQPTIHPTMVVEKKRYDGVVGHYGIFATNEIEWDKAAQEYASAIGDGIRIAEDMFGYKPGEFIKNVFIPDMDEYNAFAEDLGLNTIVISDEYFRLSKSARDSYVRDTEHRWQMQDAAMHESFHQLEANIGIRDDDRITKLFEELPAETLASFSEHNWFTEFPLRASGGHANDNPAEFLASFLMTTQDYDFDKSITAKGQAAAETYLQVLDTVEAVLNDHMPADVLAAKGRYLIDPEYMPGVIASNDGSFYQSRFDQVREKIAAAYPDLAAQATVKMR